MNGLEITTNPNQTIRLWIGIEMNVRPQYPFRIYVISIPDLGELNHNEIFNIDLEIERYEELQQPHNLREFKKLHRRSMKETKAICKKSIEQLLELKEK